MRDKQYLGRSATIDGLLFHWDSDQEYWVGCDKEAWVAVKVSDSEFSRWLDARYIAECVQCVANGAITASGDLQLVPVVEMLRSSRVNPS